LQLDRERTDFLLQCQQDRLTVLEVHINPKLDRSSATIKLATGSLV